MSLGPRAIHISTNRIGAEGVLKCLGAAGFEATTVFDDSESALREIEQRRPSLVTIGTLAPEPSYHQFTLCREITRRWPETQVIVIRPDASDDIIQVDAADAGAVACLPLTVSPAELIAACRSAVNRSLAPSGERQPASRLSVEPLTERQRDVLRLAAERKTIGEIAGELDIKPNTVKAHEAAIRAKLQTRTIREAVERALRRGLI